MKDIRMPLLLKFICGATIGFLVGMYVVNYLLGGMLAWLMYLLIAVGGVAGIWLLKR